MVYTDASKSAGGKVGVAFVVPELKICKTERLTNDLAVYTAELVAILTALSWVEGYRPKGGVLIASDSASALMSIQNIMSESRQDIVLEIVQMVNRIINSGTDVTFLWIPAHIGVRGNELADINAKKASVAPEVTLEISYSKTEVKSLVKSKSSELWQSEWNSAATGRKYYAIQRVVGHARPTARSTKEEDIISRMRFGHTGLNSTLFLIKKHEDGKCGVCGSSETVEHVIEHCVKFDQERQHLILGLQSESVPFNVKAILQRNSSEMCFKHLFHFMEDTGLIRRI